LFGLEAPYAERMALELRMPMIRLVDGTGGGGSVKSQETMDRTYVPANPAMEIMQKLMSTVPVIRAALGSVAGLARLAGRPVGIMASDPNYFAGAITAQAADKMVRFIDMCDTFHLPLVSFVDIPGFMVGIEAEKQGTIRFRARFCFAVYQARIPWCSIMLRKVFGVAGAAHGNHSHLNLRYAWPSENGGPCPLPEESRRPTGVKSKPQKTPRPCEKKLKTVYPK
jgi:acetyl-CoA carboxylase carboxyltransferase component